MSKVIDENDLKKILEIEANSFNEFLKKLFLLYPNGIDKSKLNFEEKQRFKAKELSYSVCGDIRYNDPNLSCNRCKSIRVAQLIYGDVFMRMCNGNKKQKCQETERFKHMGLFINLSPMRGKEANNYICLECGNEW